MSSTTTTVEDGTFSIQLRTGQYLSFESPEHFRMAWVVPAHASPGQSFDIAIKLQRQIRVSASTPLTSLLTDDDATFTHLSSATFGDGTYACGPCQQVSVAPPTGTGILRLTWTGDAPLTLWAGGGWDAPRRYTGQSGAREIAINIADFPRLDNLLIGLEPETASSQIGLPVRFTVAIHPR